MQNQNKCLGCGSVKQTTNIDELGYVKDLSHEYCYDCFQLMNYGKVRKHYHPSKYLEIKSGSLVLIIQSVMQLDLLFSQPITRIQPNAKYVYIINQLDLLPKDTNLSYLMKNIRDSANKNRITYEDIILMSAIDNTDINNLKEYLLNRFERDIYLFGFQNSGKTTILKGLTNNKKALNINKSGLTQEIITDELGNKKLYDMPGNYVQGYLADFLEYEVYRKMLPSKTLKPKIYQLKSTQKLVINGLIEISFEGKAQTSCVLYLSNFNKIDKYNVENPNDYLCHQFEYQEKTMKTLNGKTQITIADLVLIHFDDQIKVHIKCPKKMHLTVMESMFK